MCSKCLNLKEQTQKPVKRAIFREKLPAYLLFCKVCAIVAFLFICKAGLILPGCSNAKFKFAGFAVCVCVLC